MKKYIFYGATVLFLCMSIYFGGAVFFRFFFNSFLIETPNLNGLSFEQADSALKKSNLVLKKAGEDFSQFNAEKIYSQVPEPGSKIKEGRTIRVWVSKGVKQVLVPDFSGMDLFNAKVMAEEQGLVIKHISYTKKDSAYNKVITSDPAPGTILSNTNMISMLVSLPEDGDLVIMPELLGVDLWEARKTLSSYRLVLGEVDYIDDVDLESNIVVDASIQAGEKIKPGTVINLTISR